ncbi:ATP-binding protein [Actinacidiphila sp. ITFR-21]|uniref:ATP-binding protein n=1 Tax=Actinacidiphila sp. ITFR-21 TaxID=3075199 RepID=UPI00288A4774|nr:ATP-binding protein [Streptomyces sp. ITFR-21]WNI19024.1 ATP-binding protein [Streptomyces sp. ITFR-21]
MTNLLQDPAFWCVIAAVLIGAAIIRRNRRVISVQGEQLAQWEDRLAEQAVQHERSIGDAEAAAEERTKTVLKSATRTLQSLAGEQQVVIEDLQRKYGGHPVLHELLEVNHANAQFARRAQAIAVICGGFLGRRKDAASVYDVIRSAQGQIRNFERVQIRSQSGFGIEAKAISGISLALAELLANAANYSRPDTAIEVNIQPVHNGLCVIVDDFGVGMSDEQKQKAGKMLSGEYIPAMSELGNPPQFGFPVIAELSRRYGFSVDVSSTSPYGGVRAVVRLPEDLLTEQIVEPGASAPSVISPVAPAPDLSEPAGRTANGLPKRAARQAPMSIVRVPANAGHDAPSEDDSAIAAARMAALQQGTRSGRQPTAANREGSEPK